MTEYQKSIQEKLAKNRAFRKAMKTQRIGGIMMIIMSILLLNGAAGASIIVGPIGAWMLFSKECLM